MAKKPDPPRRSLFRAAAPDPVPTKMETAQALHDAEMGVVRGERDTAREESRQTTLGARRGAANAATEHGIRQAEWAAWVSRLRLIVGVCILIIVALAIACFRLYGMTGTAKEQSIKDAAQYSAALDGMKAERDASAARLDKVESDDAAKFKAITEDTDRRIAAAQAAQAQVSAPVPVVAPAVVSTPKPHKPQSSVAKSVKHRKPYSDDVVTHRLNVIELRKVRRDLGQKKRRTRIGPGGASSVASGTIPEISPDWRPGD